MDLTGIIISGVQWPLSNKVSGFPHFMSFKVAQEEKAAKSTSDPLASSGYMTISTPDAFDATHKRQMQVWSIHPFEEPCIFIFRDYGYHVGTKLLKFSHFLDFQRRLYLVYIPYSVCLGFYRIRGKKSSCQ